MSPVRTSCSRILTFSTAAAVPSKYLGAQVLMLGDFDRLRFDSEVYSLHLSLSSPVSPPPPPVSS